MSAAAEISGLLPNAVSQSWAGPEERAIRQEYQLRDVALRAALAVTTAAGDYQLTIRAYRDFLAALKEPS